MQLKGNVDGWNFLCSQKDNDGNDGVWNAINCPLSGSTISLTNLIPATGYTYQFTKKDEEGDIVGASNQLSIETEAELQIPNSDFETWSEKFVWKGTGKPGSIDIYTFYPYEDSDLDPWWSTQNDLTTAKAGIYSYYYVAYPGTTYVNSSWSASTRMKLSTSPINGSYSAEIATIGWGEGSTCTTGLPWGGLSCNKKTSSTLYIGKYDISTGEVHGHTFASRPTQMTFNYRFYSYNGEAASASIQIEHREGDNIVNLGNGYMNLSTTNTDKATLKISYSNEELQPTHISIVFLSSTSSSPAIKEYSGKINTWSGNADTRGIGNVLVIDDVHLEYAK